MHISRLSYTFCYPHSSGPRRSNHIAWTPFLLPLSHLAVAFRQNVHFSVISYLVGEVGFEPTHPVGLDLQSSAALQLDRSPLITPYRPTDKTCQIFSFPLEGNMLYRHLHQKVFWTGVYLSADAHWLLAFLATEVFGTYIFRHNSFFWFLKALGIANKLRVHPLQGEGSIA